MAGKAGNGAFSTKDQSAVTSDHETMWQDVACVYLHAAWCLRAKEPKGNLVSGRSIICKALP